MPDMQATSRRSIALAFAAAGIALCFLLLLLLLHPAPPHLPLLFPGLLIPATFFGLVLVPRSLWPAADLDRRFSLPILAQARLFQRPPPRSSR